MAQNNETIRAGRINGNPMTGLCERVVCEVARVFDGSVTRIRSKNFICNVEIDASIPAPYTFVSAESSGAAIFINQSTTRLEGNCTRIRGDLIIPVSITYTDANGNAHVAPSEVTLHRNILLNTPQSALVPYSITNQVRLACDVGTFVNDTSVNLVACVVILTKIIVCTDLVFPTYGRSIYPETEEGRDTACDRILNIDIFPPIE